jgi:hypothetical protein
MFVGGSTSFKDKGGWELPIRHLAYVEESGELNVFRRFGRLD